MIVKSMSDFRTFYKERVAEMEAKNRNEHFLGYSHNHDEKNTYGFFNIFHGSKSDINKFIKPFLDLAQDTQAIYEFLQNGYDSESKIFAFLFNEGHLFVFNNGEKFSFAGIESVLNIGQSTKQSKSNIGRFGVGFKIVHRLLGETDGQRELNDYAGPILFSWNNYEDIEELSKVRSIREIESKIDDFKKGASSKIYLEEETTPWLFKILLTNFPAGFNQSFYDLNYTERKDIPSEKELLELSFYVKKYLLESQKFKREDLQHGTVIYLNLGKNKSKNILSSDIISTISYSLNILNAINADRESLQKVYLKEINESIEPAPLEHEIFQIKSDEQEYLDLVNDMPEEDRPEKIDIVFLYPSVSDFTELKSKPNLFLYFPLSEEHLQLNFILHCNIFHNQSSRTVLDSNNSRNINILKHFCKKLTLLLDLYQTQNFDSYLKIYSAILQSEKVELDNKKWTLNNLYIPLFNYIQKNIPSTEKHFKDKSQIRIKKTNLDIKPLEFGVDHYEWFYWTDDENLIKEARNKSKLGIKEANICDLIQDSKDLIKIEYFIEKHFPEKYDIFLQELNSEFKDISPTQSTEFKGNIDKLKFIYFNDDKLLSPNDIKAQENRLLLDRYAIQLWDIFVKLDFSVAILNVSKYDKIKGYFDEYKIYNFLIEKLFEKVSKRTATKFLSSSDKRDLFKFFSTRINTELLSAWELFKNRKGEIRPLKNLLSNKETYEVWLNGFRISEEEYFDNLDEFFVTDNSIYSDIIVHNWDQIIAEPSIKQNPKLFYDRVNYYYGIDERKEFLHGKIVLTDSGNFVEKEKLFYNESLKQINDTSEYSQLIGILRRITELELPHREIIDIISQEPINCKSQDILDYVNEEHTLELNEAELLVGFIVKTEVEIFNRILLYKNNDKRCISRKPENVQQYFLEENSSNQALKEYISRELKNSLIQLPEELNSNIHNRYGLVEDKKIYEIVLESSINYLEKLIDIVINSGIDDIKIKYLKKINSLVIDESQEYDNASFQHKILNLAYIVFSNLEESKEKLDEFRKKIYVKKNEGPLIQLDEINHNNKLTFIINRGTEQEEKYDLKLNQILTDSSEGILLLEKIVENFVNMNKERLRKDLFGVGREKSKKEVLKSLNNTLENSQQLAFLLLYNYSNQDSSFDISKYSYEDINGEIQNFKNSMSYYTRDFLFIHPNHTFNSSYREELTELLKLSENSPCLESKSIKIKLSAYFNNDTYSCFPVKLNLKDDLDAQKAFFVELYYQFNKLKDVPFRFKPDETCFMPDGNNIVKYNNENIEYFFGFKPSRKIIPNKFAINEEFLPEWVLTWLNEKDFDRRLRFLKFIGVQDETAELVHLRKILQGDISSEVDNIINRLGSFDKKYLINTVKWVVENKIKYFYGSKQLDIIKGIYKILDYMALPCLFVSDVNAAGQIEYSFDEEKDSISKKIWHIPDKANNDVINNIKKIFSVIKEKKERMFDLRVIPACFKEQLNSKEIDLSIELETSDCFSEYNKDYYRIWNDETHSEFTVYEAKSFNTDSLEYLYIFNEVIIYTERKNKIDITENKEIYFIKNGGQSLEDLLKGIVGKNGFTQQHLDLLNEKKENEPAEIEKKYEQEFEPFNEEIITLTENQNRQDFPVDENKSFKEKLLELLSTTKSNWSGYIYHFTHLENAVYIINSKKIKSRLSADFKDSAGSSFINTTVENIKKYARFYFRPLTPTQYYNEGLGRRTKNGDLPQCPVPIFFRFNIKEVLEKYEDKCYVSNGNLRHYPKTTFGNRYDFLRQFNYRNVYSRFGTCDTQTYLNASQQEFIVENELDFSNIEDFQIVCPDEKSLDTLINMIDNSFDISKIVVKEDYYHNMNPRIIIDKFENKITAQIDKLAHHSNINVETTVKHGEESLSYSITAKNSVEIEYPANAEVKINYIGSDNSHKWLIYLFKGNCHHV